jgi:hypothetical protein
VWEVSDAESIERVASPSPGVALKMRDGSRVVVAARTAKDAERADAALARSRRRLAEAMDNGDSHTVADLDPLHDTAMSSPIGPTEKMTPRVAPWARFDWAIAAVVGLALGHVLGTTRNSISDEAMYKAVVAADTAPEYRRYLARHGSPEPSCATPRPRTTPTRFKPLLRRTRRRRSTRRSRPRFAARSSPSSRRRRTRTR